MHCEYILASHTLDLLPTLSNGALCLHCDCLFSTPQYAHGGPRSPGRAEHATAATAHTPRYAHISTGVYFAALHLFFVCAGLLCGCLLVWEEGCYCIHCQPGVARCHPRNCKESLMVVNSSSYVPPTGFMNSKHLPAPMKWGKAVDLICPLMWLRILLV